jgi:CheY-like chemotaxis protein
LTKILVVDDEEAMSRGLRRAVLLRRPDYAVSTCQSGSDAIALLGEERFDLVITDLQMPGGDGFELLAWLLSHRTSVLAFAMSAFCDEQAQARLAALGSIECFAKPLDVDALLARFVESFSEAIQGQVDNVGLASFLQLVELEQKTCTLLVRNEGKVGRLFLRKGELLDAGVGELSGEEAAFVIIGWMTVDLTIEGSCNNTQRSIWKPTHYVVMEAMRLRDEATRAVKRASKPSAELSEELFPEKSTSEYMLLPDAAEEQSGLGDLHIPVGAMAVIVIDRSSGLVVASQVTIALDVGELARAATVILEHESSTITRAAGDREAMQELVFMTRSRGEVMRPMPGGEQFVLLVFDTSETNLVMARHELALFVEEYAVAHAS